jgi:hypothetical protein
MVKFQQKTTQIKQEEQVAVDYPSVIKSVTKAMRDIPYKPATISEAERLALRFNVLCAEISGVIKELRDEKADYYTKIKLTKAKVTANASGRTATIKKSNADADESLLSLIEEEKRVDNKIKHLESLSDVCNNNHIHFRGLSR